MRYPGILSLLLDGKVEGTNWLGRHRYRILGRLYRMWGVRVTSKWRSWHSWERKKWRAVLKNVCERDDFYRQCSHWEDRCIYLLVWGQSSILFQQMSGNSGICWWNPSVTFTANFSAVKLTDKILYFFIWSSSFTKFFQFHNIANRNFIFKFW